MKKLITVLFLVTLCRIFIINVDSEIAKTQGEISAWLQDKTLVSMVQSGTSYKNAPYGKERQTLITIVATKEVNAEKKE